MGLFKKESKQPVDNKQLLLVFLHGFASNDATFEDFPVHVRTVLSNSLRCDVDAVVYPTYATSGSVTKAVDDFCDWLLKTTEERLGSAEGSDCWTVILGHSMGGLVAADAVIKLREATLNRHKVLGLVTYDSPFYGVHRRVISQTAGARATSLVDSYAGGNLSLITAAASAVSAIKPKVLSLPTKDLVKSAGSSKWAWAAAGATVGGALIGAYVQRENLTKGFKFLTGHAEFASALIKQGELRNRVETIRSNTDLSFRCFYNEVICKNRSNGQMEKRTFIEPPPSAAAPYFTKISMESEDEIDGHMNMFSPTLRVDPLKPQSHAANATSKPNAAYYTLAQETMKTVVEMVKKADPQLVRGPFLLKAGIPQA